MDHQRLWKGLFTVAWIGMGYPCYKISKIHLHQPVSSTMEALDQEKALAEEFQYMNTHCFKPPSEAFENASKTHRCFSACFRQVHLPSPGEPPASKNTRSRETSGARLVGSSCSARDMEVCALRNQSCYRKLAQPAAVVSLFYTFLSCLALTSEVKRSVAPPDPLRLLAGSPLNIGCRVEEVRTDMPDSAMPTPHLRLQLCDFHKNLWTKLIDLVSSIVVERYKHREQSIPVNISRNIHQYNIPFIWAF